MEIERRVIFGPLVWGVGSSRLRAAPGRFGCAWRGVRDRASPSGWPQRAAIGDAPLRETEQGKCSLVLPRYLLRVVTPELGA